MKNLYLLSTKKLGDFYVIADNPKEAQDWLVGLLNKQDYGFSEERRVVNIKWLTKSLYKAYNKNEPFFSDKEAQLLIVDDWKLSESQSTDEK